ncbi:MAG: hypothetical protein RLZZ293_906 [Pseudomonadota bacterium]|jgi:hypothetical protein
MSILKTDLSTAITIPKFYLADCLKNGQPKQLPNGYPMSFAGSFATVFPFVRADGKQVAIRCWTNLVANKEAKMQAISQYIAQLTDKRYFCDFKFIPDALRVVNSTGAVEDIPILEMEWVEGDNLYTYMKNNIHNSSVMQQFANDYYEMVVYLHQQQIAHGDLRNDNLKIKADGSIVMIDYDSLYLPGLTEGNDEIKGYKGFQHPKRENNQLANPQLDYFSEYVIYLSILVAIDNPDIWLKYSCEDSQLFSLSDFANPQQSAVFQELQQLSDPKIQQVLQQLLEALKATDITQIKPLEQLNKRAFGIDIDDIFNKFAQLPKSVSQTPQTTISVDTNSIINKFKF